MILTTTNPTLCRAGGDHFGVDVTIGARTIHVEFDRAELTAAISLEDIKAALLVLLRAQWRTSLENAAVFRTAITGKSWDI